MRHNSVNLLIVQVQTAFVLAVYKEERALHLGKREAIAVMQLVDRVEKVTEASAGHAQNLLETLFVKIFVVKCIVSMLSFVTIFVSMLFLFNIIHNSFLRKAEICSHRC